jgi:hypothetical protein
VRRAAGYRREGSVMAEIGTVIIDFSPMIAQLRALNEVVANFITRMEAIQAENASPSREDEPDASGERTSPTTTPSL